MFRINGGAGVDRDVFFCVEKPSCFWEQTICCSWQEGFCFQHSKICPQAWACIADYASIVLSMIEQNGGRVSLMILFPGR
ncbi:MAG TPA: hypothetical protein DE060_03500 [Lentisphaeria bacterium]|nr:hypothetical protein [Lentisphaeria bacterium]HCG48257.1 hypothetical protein [Lentisphaeria bacterium]